jgi:hypothetical protein
LIYYLIITAPVAQGWPGLFLFTRPRSFLTARTNLSTAGRENFTGQHIQQRYSTADRQSFLQFHEKGVIINLLQRHKGNLNEAPEWICNLVLEQKNTGTLAIHDKQKLGIAGILSVLLFNFIVCHRWRLYRECANEGPRNQMKGMRVSSRSRFIEFYQFYGLAVFP